MSSCPGSDARQAPDSLMLLSGRAETTSLPGVETAPTNKGSDIQPPQRGYSSKIAESHALALSSWRRRSSSRPSVVDGGDSPHSIYSDGALEGPLCGPSRYESWPAEYAGFIRPRGGGLQSAGEDGHGRLKSPAPRGRLKSAYPGAWSRTRWVRGRRKGGVRARVWPASVMMIRAIRVKRREVVDAGPALLVGLAEPIFERKPQGVAIPWRGREPRIGRI